MKKLYLFLIGIGILIIGLLCFRFILGGDEDSWIKDSRGVWVKHGNPLLVPAFVENQNRAVSCALDLYAQKKAEGMQFSSQCLGTCEDYAVDIVRVPRTSEDNLVENQCADFREGKVSHFIELDKDGEIVRVYEYVGK
jgi:hypothetical protein